MKKLLSLLALTPITLTACGGTTTTYDQSLKHHTQREKELITAEPTALEAIKNSIGLSVKEHQDNINNMIQVLPAYDEATNTINDAYMTTTAFKTLPENIQRIIRVFDEDQWEDVFNIRRDAYSYRGFLHAASRYTSFCNSKGSDQVVKEKDLDDVCRRELSSLFANINQEVGHNSLITKTDGTGLIDPATRPTTFANSYLLGSDGQGNINKKIKRNTSGDAIYPSGDDAWKTGLHYIEELNYVVGKDWEGKWFGLEPTDPAYDGSIAMQDSDSISDLGKRKMGHYSTNWSGSNSWANIAYPNPRDKSILDGKTFADYQDLKKYSYHGRGAKQLSFNYNYGELSYSVFNDYRLLRDMSKILSVEWLSYAALFHTYMRVSASKPSLHEVVTGKWTPSQIDKDEKRDYGFGLQILLNSATECIDVPTWIGKINAAGATEINANDTLPNAKEGEAITAYNRKLYWSKFTEYFGVADDAWYGDINYINDCTEIVGFWYPEDNVADEDIEPTKLKGLRKLFWFKNPDNENECELTFREKGPFSIFNSGDLDACNNSPDGVARYAAGEENWGPTTW